MTQNQFSKHSQPPRYSKGKKPQRTKSSERRQYETVEKQSKLISQPKFSNAKPKSVKKSQLRIVEKIGVGQFGDLHLCHFLGSYSSALVAVKSLDGDCASETRYGIGG